MQKNVKEYGEFIPKQLTFPQNSDIILDENKIGVVYNRVHFIKTQRKVKHYEQKNSIAV